MLDKLFAAIDAKDTETFIGFLSPECCFKFANLPEQVGVDEIGSFISLFFASIESLSHQRSRHWRVDNIVICEGRVTYTRKDHSQLAVPFANILTLRDDKISHYAIYADTSAL